MKKLFYLLSLLLATVLANAAELNVYASGLKITGMTDDRQLSISYFLNAPADEVLFQLLDASNPGAAPIYEVALDGRAKGENTATLDLLDKIDTNLSGNFTWAIKATSNTANTNSVLVGGGADADARFQFYTPAGLAVDNNSNSPYFGQIYVSESRRDQPIRVDKANKQSVEGIYIFKPDLSGGETAYAGNVAWNESAYQTSKDIPDALYAPARITIDEEGYVYICDNSPSSYKKSGVWRMNPANPSAAFVDVLDSESNYGENGKTATNLYRRINSAVVVGTGSNKKLIAIDNLGTGTEGSTHLVEFPLNEDGVSDKTKTVLVDLHNGGKGVVNAFNTLVKGIYNDYWIFQFRNATGVTSVTGIMHINNQHQIAGNIGLEYCRRGAGAVSPDGKWLAYNDNNGIAIYEINNYEANTTPSLSLGTPVIRIHKADTKIDGIAFDVAGNLYFASAEYERFYAYALEKAENTHTTVAPENQKIVLKSISPRIRMMAYNLRLKFVDEDYHFSFYANSQPISGKLLFYQNRELTGEPAYEHTLTNLKQGDNEVIIPMSHEKLAELTHYTSDQDVYWAVELTGEPNYLFGKVHENNMVLNRAHATIDNSPESDFFGRVYVENRVEKTKKSELFVFEYDHSTLVYQGLCGMDTFVMSARPAVDDKGNVYWADWGDDSHGGVYITDPHDLNKSTSFFQGNVAASGLWTNNGVGVGSSSGGVYFYGSGANAKLFVLNEDVYDNAGTSQDLHEYGYCVYNIGQSDGSVLQTWDKAPSLGVDILDNDGQVFSIIGTSHGAWLCQNRIKNLNVKGSYSLQFYDNNGVRQYCSDGKDLIINGSFGGGAAVSPDEKQLFMVNGDGDILVFDIEWNGDVPGLTHYRTYETEFDVISTMHFDYAGNLVVMAGYQYANNPDAGVENDMRLVVYTFPKEDNTILVPAPSSQRIYPALILDDEDNNSAILAEAKEYIETNPEQLINVRITRSLTGGMYNTLCLPFTLSSLEGTCLEGAKAYEYDHSEEFGGDIMLHFNLTPTLDAGVPYLVEPQEDIASPMDFMDVQVTVAEGASVSSNDIAFTGILSPLTLTANDKSILFLVSDNRLAWANTTADMYGMRGYFAVPDGKYNKLSARAYINTEESETTDLPSVPAITDQPTQKILHNGVLYILRDGAIYTIMGTKMQ